MRRDPRGLLWDAHRASEAIASFIAGRGMADYQADLLLRSAVERQAEILGEALNTLSRIAPDIAGRIPAISQAVAFRNILIHGYAVVDNAMVWRVATEDIPAMRQILAALLNELGREP